MKKISLIALLMVVGIATIAAKEPVKKVLFTMNKNEVLDCDEYYSNMQFKGFRYSLMVIDTVTEMRTLVWNGERKWSGNFYIIERQEQYEYTVVKYADGEIDTLREDDVIPDDAKTIKTYTRKETYYDTNYYYHNIVYVDVEDWSQTIYYYYKAGKGWYIRNSAGTFGPFEIVGKTGYNWCTGLGNARFQYERNGRWFLYDYDGKTYFEGENRLDFESPNGKHKARLSEDLRTLTLDGNKYILPFPVGSAIEPYYNTNGWGDLSINPSYHDNCVIVTDRGECYILWHYDRSDVLEYWIDATEARPLKDDEFFDSKKMMLVKQTYEEENTEQHNGIGNSIFAVGSFVYYEAPVWVNGYKLSDKTGEHKFIAKWRRNYVEIDGVRYGGGCPIDAFYDEGSNTFAWVVIEGQNLVRYEYAL